MRRDGAETRKERLHQIAQSVQASLFQSKESGEISLSKTVAKLMFATGLTEPKVLEYLSLLQKADQFEVDAQNDKIKRSGV
jgi:predicted nuclease of restriction endonuclease-like (RecB) superfamily